jgi:hypothetical protein
MIEVGFIIESDNEAKRVTAMLRFLRTHDTPAMSRERRNLWPGIDLVYDGSVDRLKYQLVKNPKKIIRRPFYDSPRNIQHSVESTFDSKRLVKRDPLKRGELVNEWVPGINLYTYHMLNGLFPDRRKIAEKIKKYPLPSSSPLTDISPWNFILSGEKVHLIDHTSVNNSLNKPFKKSNPQYCLFNTALCIYAEAKSLRKMIYNRKPFAIKKLLLRRTARDLLSVIKENLKEGYAVVRKFIEILVF